MSRRRLLLPLACAGVLVGTLPATAARTTPEAEALELLERASAAGERLTWTGTQYVASWRAGSDADTTLVELHHDPAGGSVVTGPADGDVAAAGSTAALDARMLPHLAAAYDLAVSGPGRCTGREATVVEARRDDGSLAGRFWVDRDTGMLLRRETYDADGDRVRSSAFVDLEVEQAATASAVRSSARRGGADPDALREDGWYVPEELPDGFALLEARRTGQVLQLAYTDGLSTLSLFAQPGELGSAPMAGFAAEQVDGHPVWVRRAAPERVVWSGGERVWTLVSDAPADAVRAVVGALPHDDEQPARGGLLDRLGRGLSRLASILNPFD